MSDHQTFGENKRGHSANPTDQNVHYTQIEMSLPAPQDNTQASSSDSADSLDPLDSVSRPQQRARTRRNVQIFFPRFQYKSFIFIITMVQIAIFLVTETLGLAQDDAKNFKCVLYKFGSKYTPAIVTYYHFHRLFLPIFLHSGLRHIFFNMLSQWFCGFRLEKFYSTKKLILIYFMAGIGGNLFSALRNPHNTSVGASSALFGLVALRIAYILQNYEQLGPRKNYRLLFLLFLVLGNLDSARRSNHIDNAAHLGGFIVGALFVVIFWKRNNQRNFDRNRWLAIIGLVLFMAGCLFLVMNMNGLEKEATKLSNQCEKVHLF